jgi:general secretion pathway protein G
LNELNTPFTSFTPLERKKVVMKLKRLYCAGFTLTEVMIVVFIIGLLAAIVIPNYVHARTVSRRNTCIANLRQIDNAKQTWAMEKGKVSTDAPEVTDLVGSDRYLRQVPICPGDGEYTLEQVSKKPTCSLGPTEGHTL